MILRIALLTSSTCLRGPVDFRTQILRICLVAAAALTAILCGIGAAAGWYVFFKPSVLPDLSLSNLYLVCLRHSRVFMVATLVFLPLSWLIYKRASLNWHKPKKAQS